MSFLPDIFIGLLRHRGPWGAITTQVASRSFSSAHHQTLQCKWSLMQKNLRNSTNGNRYPCTDTQNPNSLFLARVTTLESRLPDSCLAASHPDAFSSAGPLDTTSSAGPLNTTNFSSSAQSALPLGTFGLICCAVVVFYSALGVFSPVYSAVVVFFSATGYFSSSCATPGFLPCWYPPILFMLDSFLLIGLIKLLCYLLDHLILIFFMGLHP